MSLPRFSPKRLKEIAEGIRYRDGTLKVKPKKEDSLWLVMRAKILKASKNITTANRLVSSPKPRKKIRPRAANNKGWWDVALEVWDERKRECEVCHLWLLSEDPAPILFSHLLPRGSYRDFKRDKRNIRIKCAECHTKWHDFGPEALSADPEWKKVTDLYYSLRAEANKVNQ